MSADAERSVQERLLEQGFLLSRRLPGRWGRRVVESAQWALNYNGARGTGRRAIRFSQLARHSPLLVTKFGDGLMMVDPKDEEIGRVVYVRGEYERAYFGTVVSYLRQHTGLVPADRTILDVGANIGTTTIDALLHFEFGRAVSFEPDSRNARLLRMNAMLNDLSERVTVLQCAVSDFDGELRLARNATNSGDSRVVAATDASAAESVAAVRIDSAMAEHGIDRDDIGLLWIDVQGHESQVLRGAADLISHGVPVVIEYGMGAEEALVEMESLIEENYTYFVDVRRLVAGDKNAKFPSKEIRGLRERYGTIRQTDLLLIRQ